MTSSPDLPGMFQSVKTASNSPGVNSAAASAPSAASVQSVIPSRLERSTDDGTHYAGVVSYENSAHGAFSF